MVTKPNESGCRLSAHFFMWTVKRDAAIAVYDVITGCAEASNLSGCDLSPHGPPVGRITVIGRLESRTYAYSNPLFVSDGEIGGWVYVDVNRPRNTIRIFND